MVTNWGGWSLRWYEALADDVEIIAGFKLSLGIAFLTACASVVLGTLAALALTRSSAFPDERSSSAWSIHRSSCRR